MTTTRRVPAGELRPGDIVRVTPNGDGWAAGRSRRNSEAAVVVVARDLGPTVHRRYRLILRTSAGLVTVHASARESFERDDSSTNSNNQHNEG